jgi:hypothetical protein
MKKVRAFSLKGEFERVVRAGELPESARRQHKFKCLDAGCSAAFHLVKGHRRKENTEPIAPTFARDPGSRHREGCRYDYDVIASHHRYQAFIRDEKLFLRVNFPLGGKPTDRHPERGGLTGAQIRAAERNTSKQPVASLQVLTRLLGKEFGSLQSEALENLVLDYQGHSYAWPDVFTDSDSYARLHQEAAKKEDERKGLLIAVKPLNEIPRNDKGKMKFACEPQNIVVGGRHEIIRPVLVFENDELAKDMKAGKTMLVATRPFIPDRVLAKSNPPGGNVSVYLYVHDKSQITPVPESTWRKPILGPTPEPGGQLPLFTTP